MKLTNRTDWNTRDLQKLINECIRREGVENKRRVEIEYNRGEYEAYRGRAWVNCNWVKMIVPKPVTRQYNDGEWKEKETIFDTVKFAKVFIHELGHNRGLHHDEMISWTEIDGEWAKDFEVNPKEEKPKPERDLVKEKYQRTLEHIKQKERLLKRNQNLLKKWQGKQRYYERTYGERLGI